MSQKVIEDKLPPKIPYLIYNTKMYIVKNSVFRYNAYIFRLMMAMYMSRNVLYNKINI